MKSETQTALATRKKIFLLKNLKFQQKINQQKHRESEYVSEQHQLFDALEGSNPAAEVTVELFGDCQAVPVAIACGNDLDAEREAL